MRRVFSTRRDGWSSLGGATALALEKLVLLRGFKATARALSTGETTLQNALHGGLLLEATKARLTAAIDREAAR